MRKSLIAVFFLGILLMSSISYGATIDLGTDYFTGAYAVKVHEDGNEIKYENNNIYWQSPYPTFENPTTQVNGDSKSYAYGTYPVYQKGDVVRIGTSLNTPYNEPVYLKYVYWNKTSVIQDEKNIGYPSIVGSMGTASGTLNLSHAGKFCYRFGQYVAGDFKSSHQYCFYVSPSKGYKWKKAISISSSSNLSEGVLTLTFNHSESPELTDKANFQYALDSDTSILSGVTANLIFTNAHDNTSYPYYIDEFKGGFYEFNRNSSNLTKIKVYVGEDTTDKSLNMYFGGTAPEGYYKGADYYIREPNNPFDVYQLFSDLRWNETYDFFPIGTYSTGSNYVTYNRGHRYEFYSDIGSSTLSNFSKKNKVNQLFVEWEESTTAYDSKMSFRARGWNVSSKLYQIGNTEYICNSTGNCSSTSRGSYAGKGILTYILNPSNNTVTLNLDMSNEQSTMNINESQKNYFHITQFTYYDVATDFSGNGYDYIYNFRTKPSITTTSTIRSTTTAEPQQSITLEPIGEEPPPYKITNDLDFKGEFYTNKEGTLYCYWEGSTVVSKEITSDMVNKTINYNEGYFIENETKFLNLNSTTLSCEVWDNSSLLVDDSATINFSDNYRVYINHSRPADEKQFNEPETISYETDFHFYNYTATNGYEIYRTYEIQDYLEDTKAQEAGKVINLTTSDSTHTETIDLTNYAWYNKTNSYKGIWDYIVYTYNYSTSEETADRTWYTNEYEAKKKYFEDVNWILLYDDDDYTPYGSSVTIGGVFETQDINLDSTFSCSKSTGEPILEKKLSNEDFFDKKKLGDLNYKFGFTQGIPINKTQDELSYYCKIYTTRDNYFKSPTKTFTIPDERLYITERKPHDGASFLTNTIDFSIAFEPDFTNFTNYTAGVIVGTENLNLSKAFEKFDEYFENSSECITKACKDEVYADYMEDTGLTYFKCINNNCSSALNSSYTMNFSYTDVCSSSNCKRNWLIFYWFNGNYSTVSGEPSWNYLIKYQGKGAFDVPNVNTYVENCNMTADESNFLFWGNPLAFVGSFVHNCFVKKNVERENIETVFYWVFTIFWNFIFILFIIGLGIFQRTGNLTMSLFTVIPFLILFSYLGWVAIPVSTVVLIIIAGVVLYAKRYST